MPTREINELEDRLRAALMPPALSRNATESICEMLEVLAVECPPAVSAPSRRRWPWLVAWGGIAALLVAMAMVHVWIDPAAERPTDARLAVVATTDERGWMEVPGERWVLVDESSRLEWVADDGWMAAPDGGTMRAMRVQVVDENRIFDEQSGMVVSISEPREETVLMPVSTF